MEIVRKSGATAPEELAMTTKPDQLLTYPEPPNASASPPATSNGWSAPSSSCYVLDAQGRRRIPALVGERSSRMALSGARP